jgi:putative membrane-bound dehydrogenase-like protein
MRFRDALCAFRFQAVPVLCVLVLHSVGQMMLAASVDAAAYQVGLAKIDITPQGPIRLSGFSFRQTESVGVRQHIYARAMAIRSAGGGTAVLVTVDSIGIPVAIRDDVARRLQAKAKIPTECVAICATHSHTTPMLSGVLRTMFGAPVPPDQQQRIDQYTRQLTNNLERVALDAVADLKPSRLAFGIGKVGFSINRRTKGGPVDHELPVLAIIAPDGKVRGIYVNYACHCVVLSDYKVSGDWAGCAAEELEKRYPDSVALISIGCGADSNPACGVTGDKVEFARKYAGQIADEVERLVHTKLTDISASIDCQLKPIKLALHPLPSREEWAEHSKTKGPEGYYAQVQLARFDAGKKLPTEISYPIQTWKFSKSLAVVFLPGEVVVDYSLRLKRELDSTRLWINAYSNDAPAYIPSERILREGGYEGGGAMVYYDLPAPFAAGLEDKIIAAVHAQLDEGFKAHEKVGGTQGSQPKTPAESLATIQVRAGLRVELVASEPQIKDPVSIDFGPDGKLWVAQMCDYGCKDGQTCPPAGRISVLEDRDSDGTFETATVFLDKIAQPFGVTVWRKGVLISAAPDLLYAEDTDGDGRADVVQKIFTGFSVENPQARLNTLCYGLDGWLQAGSYFGSRVKNLKGEEIILPNSDFRLRPDLQAIDPETGRTENGRVRDDWGDWFGTDNSNLCWHYPLSDRYLRRNPHVIPPPLAVHCPTPDAARLFPRGKIVLLPLSGPVGKATAACGMGFYRDELFGAEFMDNVFTCEPVNQLVHRMILRPAGATFVATRAPDEANTEFLTSTDNWFRPVEARTGPDGALWIVDMYRYVIEHSRWIPQNVQDELDVYAGNTLGRIYCVIPKDVKPRPWPRLDKLRTAQLVAAMDSPNGPQRDMVQQLLVWRHDVAAAQPLEQLVKNAQRPATRLQAFCTLALLDRLPNDLLHTALADPHPAVRRQAVRLAESRLDLAPELFDDLVRLADEQNAAVALQLACSLGETANPRKISALAKIAERHADDSYVLAAVMSSVKDGELSSLLSRTFAQPLAKPESKLVKNLMEMAGAASDEHTVATAIQLATAEAERNEPGRFDAIEALLAGLRRNPHATTIVNSSSAVRLRQLADQCARIANDDTAEVKTRVECIRILGRTPRHGGDNIGTLTDFLSADHDSQLQLAAIDALAEQAQPAVAERLLIAWHTLTPALRARALDVLVSRKQWVAALLKAIEAHNVQTSEIDPAHQARLTEYPDPDIRKQARKSFAQSSSERAAIVARYQPALKNGDATRGQAIFEKNCTPCHKFHNVGNEVGPNIAARQDKSNEGLLREILDPNRAVDQHYAEYVAVTTDGVVKNGILLEETTSAITLLAQQGQKTTLLRSQLESLTTSGRSLMPEGFEKQIAPQEMADLIPGVALISQNLSDRSPQRQQGCAWNTDATFPSLTSLLRPA